MSDRYFEARRIDLAWQGKIQQIMSDMYLGGEEIDEALALVVN